MAIRRIRWRGGTAAEFTSANTVLKAGEVGLEENTGRIKIGDGSTAWTSLSYAGVTAGDFSALSGRVATLEGGPNPTPPATLQQRFGAISYINPNTSSTNAYWTSLQGFCTALRMDLALANPENGPGWRSTHFTGSNVTSWNTRVQQIRNNGGRMFGYISTNYFDSQSAHGSDEFRGTVGATWRFTVSSTANDEITFVADGTKTLAGAPGSALAMMLEAGTVAMGVKPWDPTLGGDLPGELAESTSYWLRPTTALPCSVYTLHTSQAGALANTGKVNISDTGTGPLFIGPRRSPGFMDAITWEMQAYVDRYPLISGWFFDEASTVATNSFDDEWDEIIAWRDANYPDLVICVNGIPDDVTRAGVFDIMMEENSYTNWTGSWLAGGSPRCPAYISNATLDPSKFWAAFNGVDTTTKLNTAVALARTSNMKHVSVVNGSYSSPLSGAYTEADVVAKIVELNA
jgi:hypothetical protein